MNVLMLLKPKSEVEYLIDTYTLRQGLEKMRAHGYTAIPVISKDGEYMGCVSEGDFSLSSLFFMKLLAEFSYDRFCVGRYHKLFVCRKNVYLYL